MAKCYLTIELVGGLFYTENIEHKCRIIQIKLFLELIYFKGGQISFYVI